VGNFPFIIIGQVNVCSLGPRRHWIISLLDGRPKSFHLEVLLDLCRRSSVGHARPSAIEHRSLSRELAESANTIPCRERLQSGRKEANP